MAFENLNDKQKEAVKHTEGPLLILAGAGSGKTSTMTHRIAYLVEHGVDPYDILAVTFTNKAAREMRERVETLIGDTLDMWILTFHAMCLRILHVHADEVGYKENFVIYDPTDQKTLVKNIVKDKGYSEKEFAPNYVLTIISECKEKEILPEKYLEESGRTEKNKMIYAIYDEYQRRLMQNNAMDFDDLLLNTVRVFRKSKETLAKYRRKFRYIMVDEYQDTNHIQYELVSMLAKEHHNICVVGDDDQCIYEWRGADIRNILDFEKDFPDAKVVKLEQNYRSDANILEAAHSVIKNNRGRKSKHLWTTRAGGEKIKYKRYGNDKAEAAGVGREISRLTHKGELTYGDIAILYRTNAQSRLFEEELAREGIPYQVLSGLRYYDRKEIKDVMAYLRLIVDPADDLSLFRIINEPKRGVGPKTIEKLRAFANVRGQSVLEALTDGDEEMLSSIPAKSYDKVKALVQCINELREKQGMIKVSDTYDQILVKTGYMKMLEDQNTVEAESRIENLMEFKSAIFDYENSFAGGNALLGQVATGRGIGGHLSGDAGEGPGDDVAADADAIIMDDDAGGKPGKGTDADAIMMDDAAGSPGPIEAVPTLAGFMSQLTLATDQDRYDEKDGSVTLMTMHSAKGLEFSCVFMPGMEDGLFPGSKSFDSVDGMEEERRLCYVGITRAKKLLYLSSAEARTRYGRTEFTRESEFLREIDKDLLEGDIVYKKGEHGTSLGVSTGSIDGYSDTPYDPFARNRSGNSEPAFSDPSLTKKPFDSLKYAKQMTKRAAGRASTSDSSDKSFKAGDKVTHPKFGSGMVIEVSGKVVQVAFDDYGIKKLAADVAPLTKIDE